VGDKNIGNIKQEPMAREDGRKNPRANSPARILLASLMGTTIEFFDFYIYATAAVLVFPQKFFPASDPATATLQSFATFALAFFARPVGSALFGHFGDRVGRKATLVAALFTMGLSTVMIGALPGYDRIGIWAPVLLALCRFGQGLGLGGELGGAVLLATENAPAGKRAWYGMFPQLGAPIGFILSNGIFLLLSRFLSESQFIDYGWRFPFLASAVLVLVGLYVRLNLEETPVFRQAMEKQERASVPLLEVFKSHGRTLVLGTAMSMTVFVIFYLMTVFTLAWGTKALGYSRNTFLLLQMISVVFFGLTIPVASFMADRYGRRRTQLLFIAAILVFGLGFGALFGSGHTLWVLFTLCAGMALMGLNYGPLGAILSELFPTRVRYTGASMTFNLAGIFGASLAPYAATYLASRYGLAYVGYYLSAAAASTLAAVFLSRETGNTDL
jgi:metabolite-proton symporter